MGNVSVVRVLKIVVGLLLIFMGTFGVSYIFGGPYSFVFVNIIIGLFFSTTGLAFLMSGLNINFKNNKSGFIFLIFVVIIFIVVAYFAGDQLTELHRLFFVQT